jgi:hypothetical protein
LTEREQFLFDNEPCELHIIFNRFIKSWEVSIHFNIVIRLCIFLKSLMKRQFDVFERLFPCFLCPAKQCLVHLQTVNTHECALLLCLCLLQRVNELRENIFLSTHVTSSCVTKCIHETISFQNQIRNWLTLRTFVKT